MAVVPITASTPPLCPRTQSSQTQVARSEKPSPDRSVFIQGPERGMKRAVAGRKLTSRKGDARPSPIARKIAKMPVPWLAKAKPTAVPRKGAVQGVAFSRPMQIVLGD